jgi:prepilin-type N-terminal cleavage/methylation domain-containing protein
MATTERGFTLIEVLVVSAILGVLSAISVQIFIELRTRSYDGRAMADIRNVAEAEEAYFAETEGYKSCSDASDCISKLSGVSALSPGVTLEITGTTTGFEGTATHPKGSGRVYQWRSGAGGLQDN